MNIKVKDTDVTIVRVTMRNLSEVTKAFSPFVSEFERIVDSKQQIPADDLMRLLAVHSENAMVLASILTDQELEFYRELEPIEFFGVMKNIINHSGDFFLQQIITPLQEIGRQIIKKSVTVSLMQKGLGMNQSSLLSNVDIESQKS